MIMLLEPITLQGKPGQGCFSGFGKTYGAQNNYNAMLGFLLMDIVHYIQQPYSYYQGASIQKSKTFSLKHRNLNYKA